jgi:hypothetical protein
MIPHFDLDMQQGSDWAAGFNWYGGGKFMAPIEEIDPGYPTKIRVTGHLLPSISDTPVILSGVQGMEILNSKRTGIELCTRIDDDYFSVPISTVAQEWLLGTGEITYYRPTDITGYTARCHFRKRWHDPNFIKELTSANGRILLTVEDAGIQLQLTAEDTAAFTFDKCVFDVEMVSPLGVVIPACKGTITLGKEITR